ncbi:MAG: hypothetical protein WCH34_02240 [Bacteroidota bacterium]
MNSIKNSVLRKTRLNQFIALSLLGVFLFYISGYYVAFGLFRHIIRVEAEQNMIKSLKYQDLQAFSFNQTLNHDFVWTENNKEFSFKGELFDVVKIISYQGEFQYLCLHDKKESVLMASFSKMLEKDFWGNRTAKHPVSKIIELLTLDSFCLNENKSLPAFHPSTKLDFIYSVSLKCIDLQVLKLPPKNQAGLLYS